MLEAQTLSKTSLQRRKDTKEESTVPFCSALVKAAAGELFGSTGPRVLLILLSPTLMNPNFSFSKYASIITTRLMRHMRRP